LRFLAARTGLRCILSTYLQQSPEAIQFGYGPAGKPFLPGGPAGSRPHFNVAHSGDWVVIAIDPGAPIGVDIERVRTLPAIAGLMRTVLADDEQAELASCSAGDLPRAFLRWWTAKEALLKAHGTGLGLDPREVRLAPAAGGGLDVAAASAALAERFALEELFLPALPGYVGFVAISTSGL
jgi:4'-phosphopantetheinyl transferase